MGTVHLHYKDHVEHYQRDGELFNYFDPDDPVAADFDRRLHTLIVRLLKPLREGILLDIGSGGGWVSESLLDVDIQVIHLDLSLKNLRHILLSHQSHTKSASGATAHYVSAAVGDTYAIPLKSESVNVVVAAEVLEHLEHPDVALREVARVLLPRGKLLLSTPYKEKIRYYLCIHCNQPTPANAHVQSFDEKRLTVLLRESGLEPKRVLFIGNKLFLFTRTSYLLRWLPFWLWRGIDRALSLLIRKEMHVIVEAQKPAPSV
ncbi:MAG: class I SAM-dependent methyltransferase [Bacteroidota bacterium]